VHVKTIQGPGMRAMMFRWEVPQAEVESDDHPGMGCAGRNRAETGVRGGSGCYLGTGLSAASVIR